MKTVLTIAGSDSSGGAGIQADIKTITAHRLYAMSAVTAMTAQNTTGVSAIQESTPEFLRSQLQSVFSDIYPDAVKIGMLSSAALVEVVVEILEKYRPANVVLDPVMISTSGSRLLTRQAGKIMEERLLPLTDLITPNIPEAEELWGETIQTEQDMEAAAARLSGKYRTAVLIKGGHGRAWGKRPAVRSVRSDLVQRRADRKQQYTWNGLHAFIGDCLSSGGGIFYGGEREARERIPYGRHSGGT